MPAVEAFRETGAGDEMETARPIRTVRRLDALGAQVSRAEQPDARERGVEVFHQPAGDFREHVCELERARHPQADPSEATLDARDAHGGTLNGQPSYGHGREVSRRPPASIHDVARDRGDEIR